MTARIGFGVRGLALPAAAVATLSVNGLTGAGAKDDSAVRMRNAGRTGR